jgi:2-methylcitrate dehydratase PrpD
MEERELSGNADRLTTAPVRIAMPDDKPGPAPAGARFTDVPDFVQHLRFDDLPADVVHHAKRCLLDLIGVAAAGSRTNGAQIAVHHATTQLRSVDHDARILFDGRRAGPPGAAFAGATMIDAIDAHDGHVLCKGHAGVAVLPSLLAFVDSGAACDDREFITCLVLGYELATRAGIALHSSVADYHCSGAWNALACAAIGARLMGLSDTQIAHALGIAEYFGPRGQIMRVCDSPSMVKDGSGWGAQTGVTAALLARSGFTGAPAITVQRDGVAQHWTDLGSRWRIREQYFKAYPVCRWAQPAIEAALALQRAARFDAGDIEKVAIESFHEAVVLGAGCAIPKTTEDAQYSLTYPVAAALVFGKLGADEIEVPKLADSGVRRLLATMALTEDAEFSRLFPAERWARVRITLNDGRVLNSEPASARGNPENPLSDAEIHAKYMALTEPVLGSKRAARIEEIVNEMTAKFSSGMPLLDALLRSTVDPIG